MIINSQGFGHFKEGMNNQDFGIETPRMVLVLDGCSGAKYSEVGTRLFSQLFSRKEDFDNLENFEDNVKCVFDDLINMMKAYYPTQEELQKEFIMNNLLFTIIACFETSDKYIVKLFGDGYIITKNRRNNISFMKFSYGKCPPYFAYKYCAFPPNMKFNLYEFKTFEFDKKIFPKIGIATDGFKPIAKGDIKIEDESLFEENKAIVELSIKSQIHNFFDDITIGILGGTK